MAEAPALVFRHRESGCMNANTSGSSATQPGLHTLLATKLQQYDAVSAQEIRLLEQVIAGTRTFEAEEDLVSMEERPAYSSLLIEGWAARSKTLENGARQITSIHIPGDFVDLHSFLLHKMDHSVIALSHCRIAMMPHEKLRWISEEHPHLSRLLWLNTLVGIIAKLLFALTEGLLRLLAAGDIAQVQDEGAHARLSEQIRQ
jgi:CRP-like cAMP-binding protein